VKRTSKPNSRNACVQDLKVAFFMRGKNDEVKIKTKAETEKLHTNNEGVS